MTRLILIACLAAAAATIGCEDPFIDPFVEGKHFTVYGYLSPFDSDHAVRVIAVRRFPEHIERPGDPQAEIDAEVTSTDLSTGQTIRWVHNLVQLDDRTYGHVFRASFLIRRGATYRLTIRRSDGAESFAETTIPSGFEAEALPSAVSGDSVVQVIRWKNVPKVEDVNIVYCAGPVGTRACYDGADGGGFLVAYGPAGQRTGNDWEIPVNLTRDFALMRIAGGLTPEIPLELYSLQMRVRALDSDWTIYDDPVEFAQPNALNNVENGFGYWGTFGNGIVDWVPDQQALEQLGIVDPN